MLLGERENAVVDSYQGMPSGMPLPHETNERLQPLRPSGRSRFIFRAIVGIAEAMP
jgi:hypothetical protein